MKLSRFLFWRLNHNKEPPTLNDAFYSVELNYSSCGNQSETQLEPSGAPAEPPAGVGSEQESGGVWPSLLLGGAKHLQSDQERVKVNPKPNPN